LSSVVLQQSGLMAVFGFIPGCLVATGLYHYVRKATFLPIEMTATRVVVVLILALLMSGVSGWLSMRKVTMADPAELF
jgi:putative ABC transport system permease protein